MQRGIISGIWGKTLVYFDQRQIDWSIQETWLKTVIVLSAMPLQC